jgi:hypothetical protein
MNNSDEIRHTFTQKERDDLKKAGHTLADGSFPIRPGSIADLNNAVSDAPRGKMPQAKIREHIVKHWKAAGKPKLDKMPSWLTGDAGTPKPVSPKADPNNVNTGRSNKRRNRSGGMVMDTEYKTALYANLEARTGTNKDEIVLNCRPIVYNVAYDVSDSAGVFSETMRYG